VAVRLHDQLPIKSLLTVDKLFAENITTEVTNYTQWTENLTNYLYKWVSSAHKHLKISNATNYTTGEFNRFILRY